MFCTSCAASLDPRLLRCARCGAAPAVASSRPPPGRSPGARPARPRLLLPAGDLAAKRRTLHLLYLVPVALLLAAITVGALRLYQRDQARQRAYADAVAALSLGDYVAAQSLLRVAGEGDAAAAMRAQVARLLAPYDRLYEGGAAALAAGDEKAAIAAFLPVVRDLPAYRDASALLDRARVDREAHLVRDLDGVVAAGDWPAAELLLQELVALDPADPDLAAQLRDARLRHGQFVYARDGDLLISSPAGSEPIVVNDLLPASWPVWSPDRSRIAFVSPGDGTPANARSLYVVNADGTGLRELADGPAPWSPPIWSPDGARIAFAVEGPTRALPAAESTVVIVDIATGAVTDATGGTLPNASSPAWSPTGDRLAFVVRPAGPVYTTSDNFEFALTETGAVYALTLATGALAPIGEGSVPDPWRIAWSPAGDEILVYGRADGTSFRQGYLYRLDAVTGAARPVDLTTLDVSMPVWSPDGTRFAYIVRADRVRVVGPGEREVTVQSPVPLSRFLSWSPSGDALLAAGSDAAGDSVVLDVGSPMPRTEIVPLAYDGDSGFAGPPQWSPLNPTRAHTAASVGGTALDVPPDS